MYTSTLCRISSGPPGIQTLTVASKFPQSNYISKILLGGGGVRRRVITFFRNNGLSANIMHQLWKIIMPNGCEIITDLLRKITEVLLACELLCTGSSLHGFIQTWSNRQRFINFCGLLSNALPGKEHATLCEKKCNL